MQGIRGLRWSNVAWLMFFVALVPMIASADGYLKLNYGLITSAWSTLESGGKNLWKAQGQAARQIDKETQQRYGYDPIEPRAKQCVSRVVPSRPLPVSALGMVKFATNRNALISQIGMPYCQLVSGADIWLVEKSQVFRVEYRSGVKAQLLSADDLARIDAKPVNVPKNAGREHGGESKN